MKIKLLFTFVVFSFSSGSYAHAKILNQLCFNEVVAHGSKKIQAHLKKRNQAPELVEIIVHKIGGGDNFYKWTNPKRKSINATSYIFEGVAYVGGFQQGSDAHPFVSEVSVKKSKSKCKILNVDTTYEASYMLK